MFVFVFVLVLVFVFRRPSIRIPFRVVPIHPRLADDEEIDGELEERADPELEPVVGLQEEVDCCSVASGRKEGGREVDGS